MAVRPGLTRGANNHRPLGSAGDVALRGGLRRDTPAGAIGTDLLRYGAAAATNPWQSVHDRPTGTLLWDGDGARPNAPVPIAILDPGTDLAASDFLIVA